MSGAPARVLSVNDRPAARHLVTHVLALAGFQVIDAGSGEEGLALAQRNPDLIVVDLRLPGIDGYELCRRLKASPATASIPVLLTSAAFVGSGDRVVGLDAGADAYLVQPFEAAELVALARALLRTRAAERRASALATELAAAVRTRDEFLSIASHELKTPLTSLQLRLDGLARDLRSGAPALAAKVELALRQTARLGALVDGLLDVSRIETGRLEIVREQVDLAQVARELAERFDAEARRAGCALVVEAPGPVVGAFDRLRLEQLVSNLLSNALKYGAGKPVRLAVDAPPGRARLIVADQGIGIGAEDVERVFGRFERAVSPRNYGGLGLGLFISRQIATAHGGDIRLVSAPGSGATFTVELPVAAAPGSPLAAAG